MKVYAITNIERVVKEGQAYWLYTLKSAAIRPPVQPVFACSDTPIEQAYRIQSAELEEMRLERSETQELLSGHRLDGWEFAGWDGAGLRRFTKDEAGRLTAANEYIHIGQNAPSSP